MEIDRFTGEDIPGYSDRAVEACETYSPEGDSEMSGVSFFRKRRCDQDFPHTVKNTRVGFFCKGTGDGMTVDLQMQRGRIACRFGERGDGCRIFFIHIKPPMIFYNSIVSETEPKDHVAIEPQNTPDFR